MMCSNAPAQPSGGRPEILALYREALNTQARLKTNPASWTCALQFKTGPRVVVEVLKTPELQRYIISAATGRGRPEEISRLVIREGAWYVTEGYNRRVYRPYEANFKIPEAYFYLLRADFQPVPEALDLEGLTVEATDGDVVTIREMPSKVTLQRTRRSIEEVQAIVGTEINTTRKAELQKMAAAAEGLLVSGLRSKYSRATGMMIEDLNAPCRYEMHHFKWLDSVDAKEFAVPRDEFEDFTRPLSTDADQHVMICHIMPGPPSLRTKDIHRHAQVLDLASGRLTRIPFQGFFSQPGCFLQDRSRVIVIGAGRTNEGFAPYEVNLRTGANRRVGGSELVSGVCQAAALSPNGKTVAMLHNKNPGVGERSTEVKLLDLASDEVRSIGKLGYHGALTWLPDGTGLLLSVYDTPNAPGTASKSTIARMDLQGTVTPLFAGDLPVVLPAVNRILHDDRPRGWMTHALDGTDPQPYLAGMLNHYFPTVSPDGTRLLFLRFDGGDPPRPYLFRLGEHTGKPASAEAGVWELATWR